MTTLGKTLISTILSIFLLGAVAGPVEASPRLIVTSDTILSGMIASLLPASRYTVEAILPPGQCPGHYDMKISDIEKAKRAELIVAFRGMPFLNKALPKGQALLLVDAAGRNWMAPESHIHGLERLSGELARRFPEDENLIARRRQEAILLVRQSALRLLEKARRAGIAGKTVMASDRQKELLAWMGLTVVGTYGRPESLSTRDVVRLSQLGRERRVVAVIDNLQSGPHAGKGIAEAVGAAHVALTGFPAEGGYLAALEQNVDAVLAAMVGR
jgi:zinc transport system substrate-binding protein